LYYEDDWLLKALMQQLLQNEHKKYKYEDWGEGKVVVAVRKRAGMEVSSAHSSLIPSPVYIIVHSC
jgi:hypothetical protein